MKAHSARHLPYSQFSGAWGVGALCFFVEKQAILL